MSSPCVSACTLILALPADRICIGPRASFGFHQPSYYSARTVATSDLGTAMFDTYPSFAKQWPTAHYGGLPASRPLYMGYDVLKRCCRTCGA